MIILNDETLILFKDYVAGVLQVPSDKVVYDVRSVFAGKTSDIGVLSIDGSSNALSPHGNDCIALYDVEKGGYIFGADHEFYYFLGSIGTDFSVVVDDTYECSFPVGSSMRGFFFNNIRVTKSDVPVKFYALRFRCIV